MVQKENNARYWAEHKIITLRLTARGEIPHESNFTYWRQSNLWQILPNISHCNKFSSCLQAIYFLLIQVHHFTYLIDILHLLQNADRPGIIPPRLSHSQSVKQYSFHQDLSYVLSQNMHYKYFFNTSTLSVASHGRERSSRPKCP